MDLVIYLLESVYASKSVLGYVSSPIRALIARANNYKENGKSFSGVLKSRSTLNVFRFSKSMMEKESQRMNESEKKILEKSLKSISAILEKISELNLESLDYSVVIQQFKDLSMSNKVKLSRAILFDSGMENPSMEQVYKFIDKVNNYEISLSKNIQSSDDENPIPVEINNQMITTEELDNHYNEELPSNDIQDQNGSCSLEDLHQLADSFGVLGQSHRESFIKIIRTLTENKEDKTVAQIGHDLFMKIKKYL